MKGSKPGERRGGRQKGTPNKMTAALREAVFKAAENAGDGDIVSYLTRQANENPASFMTLLGKLIPAQIGGDPDNPLAVHRRVNVHDLSDEELMAIASGCANGRK